MKEIDVSVNRSASYIAAEADLPKELHPLLEKMVGEYKFAAWQVTGRQMVSPVVIAKLIGMGWRSE